MPILDDNQRERAVEVMQEYFLGSDGLTIWNATIITAAREFWDEVEELAHSRAWDMLTPEEQSAEAEIKFEPIWSNGHRMFRMAERPKLVYEKYSGLSFIEYQDKLRSERAAGNI